MLFRFLILLICAGLALAAPAPTPRATRKTTVGAAGVPIFVSGVYNPIPKLLTIPEFERTGSALNSVSISAQWIMVDNVITIAGVANTVSSPGWNGVLVYFEFNPPTGIFTNNCAGSGVSRLPTTTTSMHTSSASGVLYSTSNGAIVFFGGNGFGTTASIYFTVTCRLP